MCLLLAHLTQRVVGTITTWCPSSVVRFLYIEFHTFDISSKTTMPERNFIIKVLGWSSLKIMPDWSLNFQICYLLLKIEILTFDISLKPVG